MPKWPGNVDEDEDEKEEQEHQQPSKKITRNIRGQPREYIFLKKVKSVEELDKIRFKNYCHFTEGKPLKICKSLIIPCRKKRFGKTCDFELVALPSEDLKHEIHVYAHSQHNHPIVAEEKRLLYKNYKVLMPDANPPIIFCTPDNIEWLFLQTFPEYAKLDQFRRKNHSSATTGNAKSWRIRFYCNNRSRQNCNFMFLALKTTKHKYHVFKHGEHNHHPVNSTSKKKQQPARGKSKHQMEEEEVEDAAEEERDDEEEGIAMEDEEENKEGNEVKEDNDEEEESEENHDKDEDEEEQEDEAIEEEEDDDIIVLENGDEEQQQGEEGEVDQFIETEIIEEKEREETLAEKLANANDKVYKWMAGIKPNEIEETIGDWDKLSLLKMVEMADQEIREHPQKLNLWLPWMKCAIPKCLPQIEEFNVRFEDLLKMVFA